MSETLVQYTGTKQRHFSVIKASQQQPLIDASNETFAMIWSPFTTQLNGMYCDFEVAKPGRAKASANKILVHSKNVQLVLGCEQLYSVRAGTQKLLYVVTVTPER